MNAPASITITPILVADLLAEGEQNFDLAGIDMVVNTPALRPLRRGQRR